VSSIRKKLTVAMRYCLNAGLLLGSWQETVSLKLLSSKLALTANGLGLLARLLHGRLLKGFPQPHFTENALALKLFLQDTKRLINVVVTNQYLHFKPFDVCNSARERRQSIAFAEFC
jgi:hypothetical protein